MKQIPIIAVLAMDVLPSALCQSDSKKTTQNEPGRHVTLLNQSFGEAQVQRDIAKFDRLLADDFAPRQPRRQTPEQIAVFCGPELGGP